MQSTESTTSAGAVAPRPPMHPLLKVAAVSVIAASAVGIWAMTARTHSNADAANAPANTLAAVPPVAATDTAAPAAVPAPEPTPAAAAPAKAPAETSAAAPAAAYEQTAPLAERSAPGSGAVEHAKKAAPVRNDNARARIADEPMPAPSAAAPPPPAITGSLAEAPLRRAPAPTAAAPMPAAPAAPAPQAVQSGRRLASTRGAARRGAPRRGHHLSLPGRRSRPLAWFRCSHLGPAHRTPARPYWH